MAAFALATVLFGAAAHLSAAQLPIALNANKPAGGSSLQPGNGAIPAIPGAISDPFNINQGSIGTSFNDLTSLFKGAEGADVHQNALGQAAGLLNLNEPSLTTPLNVAQQTKALSLDNLNADFLGAANGAKDQPVNLTQNGASLATGVINANLGDLSKLSQPVTLGQTTDAVSQGRINATFEAGFNAPVSLSQTDTALAQNVMNIGNTPPSPGQTSNLATPASPSPKPPTPAAPAKDILASPPRPPFGQHPRTGATPGLEHARRATPAYPGAGKDTLSEDDDDDFPSEEKSASPGGARTSHESGPSHLGHTSIGGGRKLM